jgi:hypothetical protein
VRYRGAGPLLPPLLFAAKNNRVIDPPTTYFDGFPARAALHRIANVPAPLYGAAIAPRNRSQPAMKTTRPLQ